MGNDGKKIMEDKIKNIFDNVDISELILLNVSQNSLGVSYLRSYNHLLAFFKEKVLDESSLIQGAFMIYGWMPKTLNICKFDVSIAFVLQSLKRLQDANNFDVKDLEVVKGFTNNSIVGASKLIHFIYPDQFPIWDSKICSKLFEGNVHYQVEKIENYLLYLKSIRKFKSHTACVGFTKEFKKTHYEITSIRAAELMIFLSC